MKLYIVTGASRGMGEAIARQLLVPGHCVIGISRGRSAALDEAAQACGASLDQWQHDLAEPMAAAQALQHWLAAQPPGRFSSACLINNAALLAEPGPVQGASLTELSAAVRVGLEAPLLLSQVFLRGTVGMGSARRVLNISSGLGRRAMAGSASYCAVKAGLDHLTRAMALDEAHHAHGAAIVSLAPGVIDTDMQRQLRSTDPATMPDHAMFVNLKDSGQLMDTMTAAEMVLRYLTRADFGQQPIADVRDA